MEVPADSLVTWAQRFSLGGVLCSAATGHVQLAGSYIDGQYASMLVSTALSLQPSVSAVCNNAEDSRRHKLKRKCAWEQATWPPTAAVVVTK